MQQPDLRFCGFLNACRGSITSDKEGRNILAQFFADKFYCGITGFTLAQSIVGNNKVRCEFVANNNQA